jgi:vancomycin resistance protein YoaR
MPVLAKTTAARAWAGLACLGLGLLAVLLFTAALIVGLQVATHERILPGVAVLGTPVGGLTRTEAEARLTPVVQTLLDQPLVLRVGDRSWTTTARLLGLDLEGPVLSDMAFRVGREGSLVSRLKDQAEVLQRGTDLSLTRSLDGATLDVLLTRIAAEVDRPAVDARLELQDDGTIASAPSQTGVQLDREGSRERVARALAEGSPSVDLVAQPLPPPVNTDQVAAARDELERIVGAAEPVRITAGEQSWPLDRADVVNLLEVTQPAGPGETARIGLRDEPLQALVKRMANAVQQDAQDARFSWADSRTLKLLRPSRQGRALDQEAATALLTAHILAGERAIDLPIVTVPPAVAAEDAARLNISELIEEGSTSFVGSIPEKRHNIQLAAQRLNGVVVPPGGTFSFNKEVGPTTLEAGFEWGFGITSGAGGVHTVPSVAGGICQVATTLFHAVFWGGYQLEERYWHLYWIPAYTSRGVVGLDATVDPDGGLDFKWINPTSDYVLIQASADDERVTFRLYGRKPAWTVAVSTPLISNRLAADPTPVIQVEPSLTWGRSLPIESAREGFQVVVSREVAPRDGGPVRELTLKSIYQPSHTVVLVGTANAPTSASVGDAVERVRAGLQPAQAAPARAPVAPAATPAPPAAPTFPTPNGPRTLAQIRAELGRAGWAGGSDQDALATYNRVAGAAVGH